MEIPQIADDQRVREEHGGVYSGTYVRDGTLLLMTGVALYLCWLLAKPFLSGIVWALALAVVAYPLHCRMERWLWPNTAAFASLLAVAVVLLAPGAVLVQKAAEELGGSLAAVAQVFTPSGLQDLTARYPLFAKTVDWFAERFELNEELKRASGAVAGKATTFVGGSIRAMTQAVIMLIALFYFLRDHRMLLDLLQRLLPLSRAETDRLFDRVSETIRATLYGNIVVKLVQGILGGVMFWILGLPAPILSGTAMAMFAMIPIVGTSVIWGPAAILLLIQGSWIKAIMLALWGSLVVSMIDNFLFPILVASSLRLHTLAILFSVLGGLIAFGLAGIVLGPVVVASTVAFLEIWRHRAEDLQPRN